MTTSSTKIRVDKKFNEWITRFLKAALGCSVPENSNKPRKIMSKKKCCTEVNKSL